MARSRLNLTAIELGTSGIKAVMGDLLDDGSLTIVGTADARATGKIIKGEILNMEAVSDTLGDVITKLEDSTRQRVRAVVMGITGRHIGSVNAHSNVPVSSSDRIISEEDAAEALGHAEAYSLPHKHRMLHRFQRPYVIDGSRRTRSPVGMAGSQLTANVHIVFGDDNIIRTSENLIDEYLGHKPVDVAFNGVASMFGLGLWEGQDNGILVLDIGAGVTDYVVVHQGACHFAGQITIGTEHLVNDLAIGLRLQPQKCREIVRRDVTAKETTADAQGIIQIETHIGHPPMIVKRSVITTIAQARLQEMLEVIRDDLEMRDVRSLIGEKIMICGGGALIPQITKLAEDVFGTPCMAGLPVNVAGGGEELDSPRMVTPVGLLHYAIAMDEQRRATQPSFFEVLGGESAKIGSLIRKAFRF